MLTPPPRLVDRDTHLCDGHGQVIPKEPLLKLPRPAPSLLKKLLASEVHREFSAVLQCFRHLVQNHVVHVGSAAAVQ